MTKPPAHAGRVLDWRPRYDQRSRAYGMAHGDDQLPATGTVWRPGRVLDQGSEGACCGFAAAAELAADPVPVPRVGNAYALGIYRMAQRRDQFPDNQPGTSVLATLLELRARGACTGFRWAFSAEQLAAGIVQDGPAIIGVEWRTGSYETDPEAVLRPSGRVVGGHALCLVGFIPADVEISPDAWRALEDAGLAAGVHAVLQDDGEDGAFIGQNSWGTGFGARGLFVLPMSVARDWCAAGWEAAQLEGRRVPGRRKGSTVADQDEDQQEPEPATGPVEARDGEDRTQTLELEARDLQPGDRVFLDDVTAAQLDRESATVVSTRVTRGTIQRVRVRTRGGSFRIGAGVMVKVRRPV